MEGYPAYRPWKLFLQPEDSAWPHIEWDGRYWTYIKGREIYHWNRSDLMGFHPCHYDNCPFCLVMCINEQCRAEGLV